MKTKSIVLIMISLGFGLIAAIGMSQVMGRNQGGSDKVESRDVLVALVDLDISQELKPEDVKIEAWPIDLIPEGAISSWEEVENKRLNSRVLEGSTLRESMLIDRSKFFSFGIPKGFFVHSIRVTQESSFHGLLRPGHRVDVMGIFHREGQNQKFSRIFLENIRVFAVNDQISRSIEDDGKGQKISVVQVLVTRRQAKLLGLAESVGDIKLLMRSDAEIVDASQDMPDEGNANDEVSLKDLYGEEMGDNSTTSSDIADGGEDQTPKPGFLDFLNQFKGSEPAVEPPSLVTAESVPQEQGFVMNVITPNGSMAYSWDKRGNLPTVSSDPASLPPASAPAAVVEPKEESQQPEVTEIKEADAEIDQFESSIVEDGTDLE